MQSLKILRTDLNKQKETELARVSVSQISTQGIMELMYSIYKNEKKGSEEYE